MTVASILAAKGGDVVTIEPTATLADAAKLLSARRIGAALVLGPGKRIAGILSERDIVRAVSARGGAALSEPVGQAMTRDVTTCGRNDPIDSVMQQMTDGKFRHVPVVEQGQLVGIISIGDVVKQRLGEMEEESEAIRDYIRTA